MAGRRGRWRSGSGSACTRCTLGSARIANRRRRAEGDATLAAGNRRVQAELRRVTEERDILKRPRRILPRGKGEVRVHASAPDRVPGHQHVPGPGRAAQRVLRLAAPAVQRPASRGPAPAGPGQAGVAGERCGLWLPQGPRRPARSGRNLRQASYAAMVRLRCTWHGYAAVQARRISAMLPVRVPAGSTCIPGPVSCRRKWRPTWSRPMPRTISG